MSQTFEVETLIIAFKKLIFMQSKLSHTCIIDNVNILECHNIEKKTLNTS